MSVHLKKRWNLSIYIYEFILDNFDNVVGNNEPELVNEPQLIYKLRLIDKL